MTDAPPIHRYITDTLFKEAVALIDTGNISKLCAHLDEHPQLVEVTAEFSEVFFISGTQPGQYFEHPKLLWFVAENPIRNNALPYNITGIAQCIIDYQRAISTAALQHDLDYTLSLVTSGKVPRKSGLLNKLISVLVRNGADPNCADAALAHGEQEAVQVLLDHGAKVNLLIAAGMGLIGHLQRLVKDADAETRQKALSCAANCRQPKSCRILIEGGADPNQFNPEGFHADCTSFHCAVATGSHETVKALLSCGADSTIKDTMHDGDALDWARHFGHKEIVKQLQDAI